MNSAWMGRLEHQRAFVALDERLAAPEHHILLRHLLYIASSVPGAVATVRAFLAKEVGAEPFLKEIKAQFALSGLVAALIRGFHYKPLALREGGDLGDLEALPLEVLEHIVEMLPPPAKIAFVRHVSCSVRCALEKRCSIEMSVARHEKDGCTNWAILTEMYSSFNVTMFTSMKPVPDEVVLGVVGDGRTIKGRGGVFPPP